MKNRVFALLLVLCLAMGLLPAVTLAAGTEPAKADGVYQIGTDAELVWFRDAVNSGQTNLNAALTDDIDLSGVCGADGANWTPIGTNVREYTGTFDGNGRTVSGLYIQSTASNAGLFGFLGAGGVIRNLTVEGTVSNTPDSELIAMVGGVCGYNDGGDISGCVNRASVTAAGESYVGGVCAYNEKGTVTRCINSGAVTGSGANSYVGGICGRATGKTSGSGYTDVAENCLNTGEIRGGDRCEVGGLCGYLMEGNLVNCASRGDIFGGEGTHRGGLCGNNALNSKLTNCFFNSDLFRGDAVGAAGPGAALSYTQGKTTADFASGAVCWLLNGGDSAQLDTPVWYQTLGEGGDPVPVPDSSHGRVYLGYVDCAAGAMTYNNSTSWQTMGHSWSFSSDGTTITATCGRNSAHTAGLTLTPPSGAVYSASPITASWTTDSWSTTGVAGGVGSMKNVHYLGDGTTLTTAANSGAAGEGEAPVNVGSYVAELTAGGETVRTSYTVTRAPLTVAAKNLSIYVGEDVPDIAHPLRDTHYTVTGLKGTDSLAAPPTMVYRKNGAAVTPDNTRAGTYDIVMAEASAGGNYTVTLTSGTLTVSNKSSGGGGGGGGAPSYPVDLPEQPAHGKVELKPKSALQGTQVTVTVTPDPKYKDAAVTVTDEKGGAVPVTPGEGGVYTFLMPGGKVTVRARMVWDNPFTDVEEDKWYYHDVEFCHVNDMMVGVGEDSFAPQMTTTRGMVMTMLARLAGTDTSAGETWYEAGMVWARETGISDGTNPEGTITREQIAAMLYRYEGLVNRGDLTGDGAASLDFRDAGEVSSWAEEAVGWLVMKGIIQGKGDGLLDPQGELTRAELAAMFNRYLSLEG